MFAKFPICSRSRMQMSKYLTCIYICIFINPRVRVTICEYDKTKHDYIPVIAKGTLISKNFILFQITERDFTKKGDFYVESPEEQDKVHCIILVIDIRSFAENGASFVQHSRNVKEVLEHLNDIGKLKTQTNYEQAIAK